VNEEYKKIYLSPPHMGSEEQKLVAEAFSQNWIAPCGPQLETFEKEVAEYIGMAGVVALSSGTASLHLALRLMGVESGDTVFCSSLTFVASASPIRYLGANPVFIDSEPSSWNMSPEALERAFIEEGEKGRLPKAVIVVNIYGQSADMDRIMPICNRYGVPVVEDAAESLGATYKGKKSGTFGRFGIFSFNGNKIIITSGGGMLVSNDREAIEKARFWSTQAKEPCNYYQHQDLGYNYRMSNVLAAIGIGQFHLLEDRVDARRAIFHRYQQGLSDLPGYQFMPEIPGARSTRWLTALMIDPKYRRRSIEEILAAFYKQNIEVRRVWKPLHRQPVFEESKYYPHSAELSFSDAAFENGLCLPSGSNLDPKDQDRIISLARLLQTD